MIELSDEQMGAVMHGLGDTPTWEPRELPTGVWTPPSWLIGAYVDLCEDVANSPRVRLKVRGDPWGDAPKLFEFELGGWTARSADGYLMVRHSHSPDITKVVAWRMMDGDTIITKTTREGWVIADPKSGETAQKAADRAGAEHLLNSKKWTTPGKDKSNYRIETREMWATPKSGGYGGSHFPIDLKDGRHLVLRGPWHGSPPVGWHDCSVVDILSQYHDRRRKWHLQGGSFGYFFADELVLRAAARWQPHLGVAMVYPGYGHARHEFYDLSWGAPKAFAQERRRGWGPAS